MNMQKIRTPTGPLWMLRSAADRLLKEGVISGTLDGDLHAADAVTVKAALMAASPCDFCSTPGATHFYDVPDFGITQTPTNYAATRDTGGWMACDECYEMIQQDKREKLLDRAVERHAFPKFSRRAIEELYAKFWQGMDDRAQAAGTIAAAIDFIDDKLPAEYGRITETDRDKREAAILQMTKLTRAEVEAARRGEVGRDVVAKLATFSKQFGKVTGRLLDKLADVPRKPLADVTPHWQRALDMRFLALSQMQSLLKQVDRGTYVFPDAIDINDPKAIEAKMRQAKSRSSLRDLGYDDDVRFLRAAQAYSFNAETIAAIREAARSIPREAPLSSIETPNTGAGWFWFGEPLPVLASPVISNNVNALLWGWSEINRGLHETLVPESVLSRMNLFEVDQVKAIAGRGTMTSQALAQLAAILRKAGVSQYEFESMTRPVSEPALTFSAYVVDEKTSASWSTGKLLPSTRWHWPLALTFDEMIEYSRVGWRNYYGEGGKYAKDSPPVMGEEATLDCVRELTLFFMMACVWFRQTVPGTQRKVEPKLTREAGHVERHLRRRIQREHDLALPPTVQVVALRRTERTAVEDAPSERQEGARNYHCRWIVRGHPRMQVCGPGRKDRKLIWIDAHPAGPEDKPLRTKERVYAVVR